MTKGQYRKAVFAVVYARVRESNKTKEEIKYLLLNRKKHWKGWEFVKGGIEHSESPIETARREVSEETGLKIRVVQDHKLSGKYTYPSVLKDRPGIIGQTYHLFSAEVEYSPHISIDSGEHSGFKWLGFKGALRKLTWIDQKRCLKIVDKSLKK